MPKTRVVDGGHGVLTDHSIPRKPRHLESKSNWRLTTFRGFTATDRELALAYAETNQVAESRRLLRNVQPDAPVLIRLGEWEAALRADPNSTVAMVNLGVQRANSGNLAAAESLWRQALKRNPGLIEAGSNLVRLLEAAGRKNEAQEVLRGMREFEPQFTSPR
jgi:tetratricopeptide (TPR) repeat protein